MVIIAEITIYKKFAKIAKFFEAFSQSLTIENYNDSWIKLINIKPKQHSSF
jgi:hypothetical protein